MKQKLTLETLTKLDKGKAAAAFDKLLATIIADCDDRPGETGERSVTLIVTARPGGMDEKGNLDVAEVGIHLKHRVPKRKTRNYVMRLVKEVINDQEVMDLLFDDDSPDDPRQGTFSDLKEQPPVIRLPAQKQA